MDRYIDYREVSLYGRYFLERVLELVGASPMLDVELLRQKVLAKIVVVEDEQRGTNAQRSSLRTERGGTEESAEALADSLRRFHLYVQSLPAQVSIDLAAFFPSGNLGTVSGISPENLLMRADEVLRGFVAPANAEVPELAPWEVEIAANRLVLADAISGKHGAIHDTTGATSSLVQARRDFLHVYQKVARPLIRGLLAELGREHELRRYFRDMQIPDRRPPGTPEAPETPEAPAE